MDESGDSFALADRDVGMNLVDTANVYSEGRSEELVGEWIRGKRDRVLLATKCRYPIGFGMLAAGRKTKACRERTS